MAKFSETNPKWTPLAAIDSRAAWQGTWPEMPEASLRIEAAAWRGRPVYFEMIGPWTRPWRMQQVVLTPGERVVQFAILSLAVGALLGAALLARYNHLRGRGDRRGAMRLGIAGFAITFCSYVSSTDYFPTSAQVGRMFSAIGVCLLIGVSLYLGYMAMEPYVRRHWPKAIVSWTRLIAGGVRDPLVGRDILIGVMLGVIWGCIFAGGVLLEMKDGGPHYATLLHSIVSPRYTFASLLNQIPNSFVQLFVTFLLLFVVRLVLRREWLAAIAFLGLYTSLQIAGSSTPILDAILGLAIASTVYIAMTRFGFVTFVTSLYVFTLMVVMPVTIDFSVWYSNASALVMVVVIGLAAYGMHTALAGRSIIQDELL